MWLEPAFPWTFVVFLVFHRLRAMEGVWWMIAAILRQIAAARQPDGWPDAPWWRRCGGEAVALERLPLLSLCWPTPPLWAWFFHLLST